MAHRERALHSRDLARDLCRARSQPCRADLEAQGGARGVRDPVWRCRGRTFDFAGGPLVMGIVNLTPDSFSDGGRYQAPELALARARELAAEGADLVDLGAESTRPGSRPVPAAEQLRRLLPV